MVWAPAATSARGRNQGFGRIDPRLLEVRFWERVDRSGGPDACWPYMGSRGEFGYGRVNRGGRVRPAHRVAYEYAIGPIPEGAHLRHSCDSPPCCNPRHLLPGSNADNVRDAVERGRTAKGERSGKAKLSDEQVLAIRLAYKHGIATTGMLAAVFKVDSSYVWRLVNHERREAATS